MYTETELREALQHSAERADEIGDELPPSAHGRPLLEQPSRRRPWLPAVAAAAVVAVVGAGVLISNATHDSGSAPGSPQHKVSAAASPTTRARTGAGPRTRVAVNNLVTVGRSSTDPDYQLSTSTGPELVEAGGLETPIVIALPPSARFDPVHQFAGAQRVQVAGTLGYYGTPASDPLDAGVPADKTGPPHATLAWKAADGSWIFMRSGNSGENLSLSTLLKAYRTLQVSAGPAPLRLPFQVQWLPAGLAVTSLDVQHGDLTSDVTLVSGKRTVDISLTPDNSTIRPGIGISGDPNVLRHTQGFWVWVSVHGYPKADAQRIFDSLDLSRLHGTAAGWWSLTDAFNG